MIRPGENKRQWHLLPLDVIEIVVDVFQAGAEKHAPFGWQRVEDWRVQYEDALMRHWAAYKRGETADPDDGKHPLAHLLADGIILLWHEIHGKKKA